MVFYHQCREFSPFGDVESSVSLVMYSFQSLWGGRGVLERGGERFWELLSTSQHYQIGNQFTWSSVLWCDDHETEIAVLPFRKPISFDMPLCAAHFLQCGLFRREDQALLDWGHTRDTKIKGWNPALRSREGAGVPMTAWVWLMTSGACSRSKKWHHTWSEMLEASHSYSPLLVQDILRRHRNM